MKYEIRDNEKETNPRKPANNLWNINNFEEKSTIESEFSYGRSTDFVPDEFSATIFPSGSLFCSIPERGKTLFKSSSYFPSTNWTSGPGKVGRASRNRSCNTPHAEKERKEESRGVSPLAPLFSSSLSHKAFRKVCSSGRPRELFRLVVVVVARCCCTSNLCAQSDLETLQDWETFVVYIYL